MNIYPPKARADTFIKETLVKLKAHIVSHTIIVGDFNILLGPSKHRCGCSQSAIGWITGPPLEELEKGPKELKGSATYRRNNNMN